MLEYTSLRDVGTFETFVESVITKYLLGEEAHLVYFGTPMHVKAFNFDVIPIEVYGNFIAMFFLMSGMMILMQLIIRLQTEKVNKIRELMRTLGMTDTAYYVSYFIFHLGSSLVVIMVQALLLKSFLLNNISYLILFVHGLLLMINIFAFALIIKYGG